MGDVLCSHPEYFWGYYGKAISKAREATPHDGYYALISIVNYKGIKDVFFVTTNTVDILEKARKDLIDCCRGI